MAAFATSSCIYEFPLKTGGQPIAAPMPVVRSLKRTLSSSILKLGGKLKRSSSASSLAPRENSALRIDSVGGRASTPTTPRKREISLYIFYASIILAEFAIDVYLPPPLDISTLKLKRDNLPGIHFVASHPLSPYCMLL